MFGSDFASLFPIYICSIFLEQGYAGAGIYRSRDMKEHCLEEILVERIDSSPVLISKKLVLILSFLLLPNIYDTEV